MSSKSIVLDANAVLRAVGGHREASAWLERVARREAHGYAPELIHAEVANGLLQYVRAGDQDLASALKITKHLRRLPLRLISLRDVAGPALDVAAARALSAYDACYVVVAEAVGAPLLTADRRLSEAAAESILLT
jgi:predicted nucleic acid-binding protein